MELNVNEASAKELLAYYQEKCDEEARQAKKEGRLVGGACTDRVF